MFKKEIYSVGQGFGYRIYLDDKLIIDQPHLPGAAGHQPMSAEEAEAISNIVLEKLQLNESPAVSAEEISIRKRIPPAPLIDWNKLYMDAITPNEKLQVIARFLQLKQ